jgi:hypothetical protein
MPREFGRKRSLSKEMRNVLIAASDGRREARRDIVVVAAPKVLSKYAMSCGQRRTAFELASRVAIASRRKIRSNLALSAGLGLIFLDALR